MRIFKLISAGLALGASLLTASAQTYGTLTYSSAGTNGLAVNSAGGNVSSGASCIGSQQVTLYGSGNALSNTVAPGIGNGSVTFPVYGSPDPATNGALYYLTSNTLTMYYTSTNPTSGSVTFDSRGMQCFRLGPPTNTGTNAAFTNFDNGKLRYFFR